MRGPRSPDEMVAEAVDAATAALGHAHIRVIGVHLTERGAELRLRVDDQPLTVDLAAVAYCTGRRAQELIAQQDPDQPGVGRLLVADRITQEARASLTDAGWSWLDRRGRLHLRGPGVRVDVEVPLHGDTTAPGAAGPPITGRSGVTVAYWLCAHPGASLSPTRHKAELRLAPSTISTTVRRLADAGLVDDDGAGVFPELFWELASAWQPERTWLIDAPEPSFHQPADPRADTWRRTGTAAAAAYGAPVVTAEGGPLELYVPSPVVVSVAVRRHGAAQPGAGAAALAVAPVPAVVAGPGDDAVPLIGGWPAAPLLAVALDLARDRARGRQILDEWTVPDAVWR